MKAAIGQRFRDVRMARGLSLAKLAGRLGGRDSNNIARVERGEAWPSLQTLIAVCQEFEVSADYLLFEKGAAPKSDTVRRPFELLAGPAPAKERATMPRQKLPPAVAAYLVREGAKLSPELVEMLKKTNYADLGLEDITLVEVRNFVAALDEGEAQDDD